MLSIPQLLAHWCKAQLAVAVHEQAGAEKNVETAV